MEGATLCQHRLEVHSTDGRPARVVYACSRMAHPGDPWHETEQQVERGPEHLVDVDELGVEVHVTGARFRWRGLGD